MVKLKTSPIIEVKALHTGPNAFKCSTDDACSLEPSVSLAHRSCVMLSSNLWDEEGLVNGPIGSVDAIYYNSDDGPLQWLQWTNFS